MKKEKQIKEFWNNYVKTIPENEKLKLNQYEVWHFCDSQESADRLVQLVLQGIKTATCGMVWNFEADGEKLPEKGDLSIIIDWKGQPLCIIETTEATLKPFNEVGAMHAFDEGEGDRSLEYWRRVHWEVFSRECAALGKKPTENMPLLCEQFRVLFPEIKKSG